MFFKMLAKPGQSQKILTKMPKTILIRGGAGMGKTLLAEAVATEGLSFRSKLTLKLSDGTQESNEVKDMSHLNLNNVFQLTPQMTVRIIMKM